MIETTELTLSHVGLGSLDEFSALTLFGVAQAHCMMEGTGRSIAEITDHDGRPLYPAYFMTHLRVPFTKPLERHGCWTNVSVGVAVQTFGGIVLDSKYVLGMPEEVIDPSIKWPPSAELTSLSSGAMFVLATSGGFEVAEPAVGILPSLPRTTAKPEAMSRFAKIKKSCGLNDRTLDHEPFCDVMTHSVLDGREASSHSHHAVMFSKLIQIMHLGEMDLLARRGFLEAGRDSKIVQLAERETFFVGSCGLGETIRVRSAVNEHATTQLDDGAARIIRTETELLRESTGELLACCSASRRIRDADCQNASPKHGVHQPARR